MNYKTGNNEVENKITNYFPVLIIEFNQFKMTYYLKCEHLYSIRNYFFTQDLDENGVMCGSYEGAAVAQIQEFKANPNYENLVKSFVKAVKDYNNPSPSVNAPQYLDHYFSIICREHIITTSLLDKKHRISPNWNY